jgi:antibiotic biosynthesis monooxygenase (ABM) superfamily enzyme
VPIIAANTNIVTQINVFTVQQGGQQAFIELLTEAAQFVSNTPGWISAGVHRSLDGTRVVNYAQSESLGAAQRIIDSLREGGSLERNKSLSEAHPGLYDEVFVSEK